MKTTDKSVRETPRTCPRCQANALQACKKPHEPNCPRGPERKVEEH